MSWSDASVRCTKVEPERHMVERRNRGVLADGKESRSYCLAKVVKGLGIFHVCCLYRVESSVIGVYRFMIK